jgi:hypothetical protein
MFGGGQRFAGIAPTRDSERGTAWRAKMGALYEDEEPSG